MRPAIQLACEISSDHLIFELNLIVSYYHQFLILGMIGSRQFTLWISFATRFNLYSCHFSSRACQHTTARPSAVGVVPCAVNNDVARHSRDPGCPNATCASLG